MAPGFLKTKTYAGEQCGTKAFGPDPNVVCDEGLRFICISKNGANLQSLKVITFDVKIISFSCQQWQGMRAPGAYYCFGPCIAEGGETSKVKLPKKMIDFDLFC